MLEFTDPIYARERLIACRNPLLALERARKREALLQATERELDAMSRRPRAPHAGSRARRRLPCGVEEVLNRSKMGNFFLDRDHGYAAAVYP